MSRKKKHTCQDHWEWEVICGIRVSRVIDDRCGYRVRCGICGHPDFVDDAGASLYKNQEKS